MATANELRIFIAATENQLADLKRQLIAAENVNDQATVRRLQQLVDTLQAGLADARRQLQTLSQQEALGTASAGQVVAEEAQARAENAATSNPVPGSSILAPDGRINRDNIETGTNAPVRTQEDTQSTPPASNGSVLPYASPGDEDAQQTAFATQQPGAAAAKEDGTRPNSNATAQLINSSFNQRITPRKNVLDEYASYTYAISWYLLTPDQYNEMTRTQKKNVAGWQLLMQSGGAPTQVTGITDNSTATATAGRNQFFSLDYYIDDLEIDSVVPLKGTGAANTATNIKFRVTEPNGITLIKNLSSAVKTLYQQKNVDKNANYPMAQYCLVVRFYGYNENGELITTGRRGTNGQNNLTDPRAIIEKFYPFVITNIKFRIPKDRVVEYDVEARPIPHFYNKSQDRGTIPFAFELTGETLEQVLIGKPAGIQTPESSGQSSTPQPNNSGPTQPPPDGNSFNAYNQAGF